MIPVVVAEDYKAYFVDKVPFPHDYFQPNGRPIEGLSENHKILRYTFRVSYSGSSEVEVFEIYRVFGHAHEWLTYFDVPQGMEKITSRLRKEIIQRNL